MIRYLVSTAQGSQSEDCTLLFGLFSSMILTATGATLILSDIPRRRLIVPMPSYRLLVSDKPARVYLDEPTEGDRLWLLVVSILGIQGVQGHYLSACKSVRFSDFKLHL